MARENQNNGIESHHNAELQGLWNGNNGELNLSLTKMSGPA